MLSLDINECLHNNANCSEICSNAIGSFACSCNIGYMLNADNRTRAGECFASFCEEHI